VLWTISLYYSQGSHSQFYAKAKQGLELTGVL